MTLLSSLTNEELITLVETMESPTDLERELALRLGLALDTLDYAEDESENCGPAGVPQ